MHPEQGHWELLLYVVDNTPKARLARANLESICEQHLAGHYRITVVDLQAHPERAKLDGIVAIPTVVRHAPEPERRVVGSLTDAGRVLKGLAFLPVIHA